MNKKYQIFISSTYTDLKSERDNVIRTILKMYHFPIGMEMFSADDEEQWEQIKNTIDSSDYYIIILCKRYGSLVKEGISYTEKEYDYALSIGIPILSFVASDSLVLTSEKLEDDPKKIQKMNKFVEKVKKRPCEFWNNTDDLANKVSIALYKSFEKKNRLGWTKGSKHIIDSSGKNSRYIKEMYQVFENKMLDLLSFNTVINRLSRKIVINFLNSKEMIVNITTEIDFESIDEGVAFYNPSPVFRTEREANSYRHLEFKINNHDYINNIQKKVEYINGYQYNYKVQNTILIPKMDKAFVIHKTNHICDISSFFQSYQLLFPCKSFELLVFMMNNTEKFYMTGTLFSTFNVSNAKSFAEEFREDNYYQLSFNNWLLPGSGYSIIMQKEIVGK